MDSGLRIAEDTPENNWSNYIIKLVWECHGEGGLGRSVQTARPSPRDE